MKKSEHKTLCASAKSREQLARRIEAIATECGAIVTRWENYLPRDRAILLTVAKGDWRVMIDFDGKSKVGAFLGHWYADSKADSGIELPKLFDFIIRGSMNAYHRRKATSCQDSFEAFADSIKAGLLAL